MEHLYSLQIRNGTAGYVGYGTGICIKVEDEA